MGGLLRKLRPGKEVATLAEALTSHVLSAYVIGLDDRRMTLGNLNILAQ
jgi:hypothetical protein